MLFNSFAFLIFFPTVFCLYWLLHRRSVRVQNILLVVASYYFYGCWDYRFLSLIIISSIVDYFVALKLEKGERQGARRVWLLASLVTNLGILGAFKYCDFFVSSAAELLDAIGFHVDVQTLGIVLPVGISFYTFQTLSYSIDVYRRKVPVCHDPVAFFAFVSFFPQLVAGPIERASSLLPQFLTPRTFHFDQARDGLRQILWGLTKKVLIADNLSLVVDEIFASYQTQGSVALWLGLVFFALQIYCDFSGYSDIAIGSARLLGFSLMRNFALPYFSQDLTEFWRRWHISLSTWFRDYVYIPLGGGRGGTGTTVRNLIITFVISGLWHGAEWKFVVWGFIHGLCILPSRWLGRQGREVTTVAEGRWLPTPIEVGRMALTFFVVLLAWAFFRADSAGEAMTYLVKMFTQHTGEAKMPPVGLAVVLCVGLLAAEWLHRTKRHVLDIASWPVMVRWATYILLMFVVLSFGNVRGAPFIYFQF